MTIDVPLIVRHLHLKRGAKRLSQPNAAQKRIIFANLRQIVAEETHSAPVATQNQKIENICEANSIVRPKTSSTSSYYPGVRGQNYHQFHETGYTSSTSLTVPVSTQKNIIQSKEKNIFFYLFYFDAHVVRYSKNVFSQYFFALYRGFIKQGAQ